MNPSMVNWCLRLVYCPTTPSGKGLILWQTCLEYPGVNPKPSPTKSKTPSKEQKKCQQVTRKVLRKHQSEQHPEQQQQQQQQSVLFALCTLQTYSCFPASFPSKLKIYLPILLGPSIHCDVTYKLLVVAYLDHQLILPEAREPLQLKEA